MRLAIRLCLLLLALSLPLAARGAAQEAGAAPAASERVSPPAAAAEAPRPAQSLRPYWHVFIAFAVTWVLLFGYALSLGRRLAGVETELQRLGGGAPRG